MRLIFAPLLLLSSMIQGQNVGINPTGAAPDASAMLDVSATNRGLLVPRIALTAANVAAPVATPTASLFVYNTATAGAAPNAVTPGYYYWSGAPTNRWIRFAADGEAWRTTGNDNTVAGTNFIGTTNAVDFVIKTGGAAAANERLRVMATGEVVAGSTTPFAGDRFSAYAAGAQWAVNGYSTGTGAAGYFEKVNAGAAGYALGVYNNGTAAAASITSQSTVNTGDALEITLTGNAANRGIDLYHGGATNTGIGIAAFQYGLGRAGNFQNVNAVNNEVSLFASTTGTGRVVNAQNTLVTHASQVGFFHQASTGVAVPAYQNAAALWGQSLGIRGGVFLAAGASNNSTVVQGGYSGPVGALADGVGVFGNFAPAVNYGYGVVGQGNWYAVFSNGDFGAAGLKLFQIDHPSDPENKYLRHFVLEAPEPLNMYRGTAITNSSGRAVVQLPGYFHAINIDFSYSLTPIGAPAQAYIEQEIDANGTFTISGGAPGQKICWNVYATRNDEYVRQNPEKLVVEMDKKEHDKGLYLQPHLYGQPEEKGIFHRYAAEPYRITVPEELSPAPPSPPPGKKGN